MSECVFEYSLRGDGTNDQFCVTHGMWRYESEGSYILDPDHLVVIYREWETENWKGIR